MSNFMLLNFAAQAVLSLMDGKSSCKLSANFAKAVSASSIASISADDFPTDVIVDPAGVVRSGVVRSGTIGVPPVVNAPEVDGVVARKGVSTSSVKRTIEICLG